MILPDFGALATAAGLGTGRALAVVIDDASMTPQIVAGFPPDREVPMIWRVAARSLRAKLLFIMPPLLLLSALAPWAITPLLGLGGLFLSYEGAHKVLRKLFGWHEEHAAATADTRPLAERENDRVDRAAGTDFILSCEIMAVGLSAMPAEGGVLLHAIALVVVALVTTGFVYGFAALVVNADDRGLRLIKSDGALARGYGRLLLKVVPKLLDGLRILGTAAMLWVGGELVNNALAALGAAGLKETFEHLAHTVSLALPAIGGVAFWLTEAVANALLGLAVGTVLVGIERAHIRKLG